MRLKLPGSTQNWISLIGATIALISFFMIVFLFTVTTILDARGSYIGLVIYILLPAVMVTGLLLIPIGMIFKLRQTKRDKRIRRIGWPKIDLNDHRHRNAFFIFLIGTAIFLFLSAIGSYEAFHFTESVSFCGTICHEVMKPEYVAYQTSSHARVACVDCHVGSGADWYVRSKLSGMYQIYAVLANVYPKPIETPVRNLRPARETCEHCHWPQKFYSRKLRQERHYLADETNTEWDIHLSMKIGAEYSAHGLREGIHWHINPDVKMEYVSTDRRLQTIEWVRYTNLKTGEVKIYRDSNGSNEEPVPGEHTISTMDCMDCHNRPSHNYRPPYFFINEAMTAGSIPVALPGIKMLAMEICDAQYESSDSAVASINRRVRSHYAENYPEIDTELVEEAAKGIEQAFSSNIFPEMKVRWDAYPNFIGHLEFNGCFRCHNDTHTAEDGSSISMDCNICHSIIAQGKPDEMEYTSTMASLAFRHPTDIDGAWKESLCSDCHSGLSP